MKKFITEYNLRKLIPQGHVRGMWTLPDVGYFPLVEQLLSEHRRSYLQWLKLYLENPQEIPRYLQAAKLIEDSYVLLYPPSRPAYHSHSGCHKMKISYFNITLPKGIRGIKDNAVIARELLGTLTTGEDLRGMNEPDYLATVWDWIRLIQQNPVIQKSFDSQSLNINALTAADFMKFERNNSGCGSLETNPIEKELVEFDAAFRIEIKLKGYKRKQAIDTARVNFFRAKYEEYFFPLIIDFLIKQYNPHLAFDETLLSSLNFRRCGDCCGDSAPVIPKISAKQNEEQELIAYLNQLIKHYELTSFGTYRWANDPASAISTMTMKRKPVGLYYGESLVDSTIQAFIREADNGPFYIGEIFRTCSGEILETEKGNVIVLKAKDIDGIVKSSAKPRIIVIPVLVAATEGP